MLTKRQWLAKRAKRLHLSMRRNKSSRADVVFIFGEMRSGTNMLARALERHERVECFHENDDEAFEDYVLRSQGKIASLVRNSPADKVIFKSIADMGRASELMGAFPEAAAIFIYRHFDDVVNSALKNFSEHREYLRLVLEDEPRAGWRRWGLSSQMIELLRRFYTDRISDASARALIWYVRNLAFLDEDLVDSGRVAIVNYEALVQDPHAHFRLVTAFIGLDYSAGMQAGVVATSVRRAAAPDIDPGIHELCSALFNRLEALAAKQQTACSKPPIGSAR